jgi:hypothetical protein
LLKNLAQHQPQPVSTPPYRIADPGGDAAVWLRCVGCNRPEKGWGNGLFVLSEKTLEKESEATGRAEGAKPLLPAEGEDRSASLLTEAIK